MKCKQTTTFKLLGYLMGLLCLPIFPLTMAAQVFHAPANFKTPEALAVFVDFKKAVYNLNYDSKTRTLIARSQITFEMSEEGMPLFDLVENPSQIFLNGQEIQNKLISTPGNETKLRLLQKSLKPGTHLLEITSPVTEGVQFLADGVSSAFWFSDLDDRSYLEAYLPTNYEYDQYRITFNIQFNNFTRQKIFSNGAITQRDDSTFTIEFPENYTSSSLYFHTAPIGRYKERLFSFTSIDGRDIPVTAYSADSNANLELLKTKITQSLTGLESQYGAYLHSSLTVFNAGSGGMEYCGATMTDMNALNHELTHSYFARGGLMPANGNAGWLDEAITTWSDTGSRIKSDLGSMKSNMAGHSMYRRSTDMDAYSKGKSFMSYLHYKFQGSGGLTSFLNHLIQTESFKPMTTEEFILKISSFYSEDLKPLFKKHTYATPLADHESIPQNSSRRVIHMKMPIREMAKYL